MMYKKANRIRSTDAAYIAGLIDGEGTISLSRKHRGENRQLVISISNTEGELLRYVQGVSGVGHIIHKNSSNPNHTPSLVYSVTNRQALSLLTQISPYLKSYKSGRAALVLTYYLRLTPRNGKYTLQQREERKAFIGRFLKLHPNSRPSSNSFY